MAEHWQFLFAVFCMYGFIFMMYTLSDGAIYGLPSASIYEQAGIDTTQLTFSSLWDAWGVVVGFISILFIPIGDFWWLTPFNWAIVGTATYILIKEIILPVLSIIAEALPF